MKKKAWLLGIVILLLVITYLAGENPSVEPDLSTEIQTENIPLPMEKAEEVLGPKEEPKEDPKESLVPEKSAATESAPSSEPKETVAEEKVVCTLSVECGEVLQHREKLAKGKETIIPKDGVFYPAQTVEFLEGESVFDVLYRELRSRNIHFEFVKTPAYHSVYIEGIGNLYEFDCGDYSGWTYLVNGVKPNVGCSQYPVKPGDVITFYYTCNFLKDR